MTTANDNDLAALKAWFSTWDKLVDAVDFTSARHLFHDDVVGFGTRMDSVSGLDALERHQWRNVWPTIDGFRFATDTLQAMISPDRLQATAVIAWSSTGYHEDGKTYTRNGRATVVFTRADTLSPWLGRHTHMSLNPGTPQRSHGKKPERVAA